MSEECRWLHQKLEALPLIKYPFELRCLPENEIYFTYEEGEMWGHGGNQLRVVQVGTHRANNFHSRIAEHYLLDPRKMDFDHDQPKPSDRSIFRKHIGRALLRKAKDPYLDIWNIDFTILANRTQFAHCRDIPKEKRLEEEITERMRSTLQFRFIIIEDEEERMGEKGLEKRFIGTFAQCCECSKSSNWLGDHSTDKRIVASGMWQIHHLKADAITHLHYDRINNAISQTQEWMRSRQCCLPYK